MPCRTAPTSSTWEELFAAIKRGDEAVVDRLLAADPTLANSRDAEGSTPLLTAVDFNRAALVPLRLRHGADPRGVYAHSAHTPAPPAWATSSGSARSSVRMGA